MTDRVKGFVVTLADDVREEDAEAIAAGLRLLRGVIDVRPVASEIDDMINRMRIRNELVQRLWAALHQEEPQ